MAEGFGLSSAVYGARQLKRRSARRNRLYLRRGELRQIPYVRSVFHVSDHSFPGFYHHPPGACQDWMGRCRVRLEIQHPHAKSADHRAALTMKRKINIDHFHEAMRGRAANQGPVPSRFS